jgi:hypothetical protein
VLFSFRNPLYGINPYGLIDAQNERVARWYAGYGAVALLDVPLSLVLPLAIVADALSRGSTDASR